MFPPEEHFVGRVEKLELSHSVRKAATVTRTRPRDGGAPEGRAGESIEVDERSVEDA